MCGRVRFEVETRDRFSACYCKMCQRWSSGTFMGVHCESFALTAGAAALTVFKSSDWAERAFCSRCGSNIYYHAPEFGAPSVALGTLENTDGLEVSVQYFIDRKPEGFALANETKDLTEAEIEAMYGGGA